MYSNNSDSIGVNTSGSAHAGAKGLVSPGGNSNWYMKLARAWGSALDNQADKTVAMANNLNHGDDSPGAALQVSAAAHQLSFLSTAASTASNSIGQALETLGKKQ